MKLSDADAADALAYSNGYKIGYTAGRDSLIAPSPTDLTPEERIEVFALGLTEARAINNPDADILYVLRRAALIAGPEGMQHLAPAWIKEWRSREESARAQGK